TSLFILFLQFTIVSTVQPYMNKVRNNWLISSGANFKSDSDGLRKSIISSNKIWYKGKNYFMAFRGFDQKSNIIKSIDFFLLDYEQKKIKEIIFAQYARYKENNLWEFFGVTTLNHLQTPQFPIPTAKESTIFELSET